MLIKSLSLTNVRSYERLSLELPSGYILFKGDVGSGKSTVLMAIEFALFGLGSIKADSLISKKAKRCEVVLRFEVDGVEYEIGRAVNKKDNLASQDPASSYIMHGGTSEPLTPSDLKARVLEILNFHEPPNPRAVSRVYRYAVYTPQEEIKSILEDRGDREEAIRKAFGMEDYKVAAENAGLMISQMNRERDKLSGLFERLADNTTRLEEVRKEAAGLSEEVVRLSARRDSLNAQKTALDAEISEARDRMAELDRMQAELDQVKKDMANHRDSRKKYAAVVERDRDLLKTTNRTIAECNRATLPTKKSDDEIYDLIRDAIERDRRIHTARSQLEKHEEELAELHGRLVTDDAGDVQEALDQLVADIASGEDALREAEKMALEQAGLLGEKASEVKMLADGVGRVVSLGSRCEYCGSELTPEHAAELADERRAKLAAAESELAAVKRDNDRAEAKAGKIRSTLKENTALLPKMRKEVEDMKDAAELGRAAERLQADLARLEGENAVPVEESFPVVDGESAHDYLCRLRDALAKHAAAAERVDILSQQKSGLTDRINENVENVKECERQIRLLEARSGELAAELMDSPSLNTKINGLQAEIDDTQSGLLEVEGEVSAKQTLSRKLEEDEAGLQTEIAEAKKHMDKHKKFGDHAEWLREYFVPSLRETEREVMNSLRDEFNGFYSKWYSELVDDPTKTSSIDERFGPVMEQDGFQQEFAYLSGGEKTSVSLAYRLALNSTMRRQAGTLKSNLLILDEPTDGFSKSQLVKVRSILMSLMAEQVIMVSHEEELEGYVDHVYGVTKNEGVSTVAKLR